MSIQQLSLTFRLQHLNAVKIGSAFLCGNWSLAQDEEQQSSYSFIVDHSFSRITQADREEYWKIPCEIYACDSGDTAECVAACGWVCRVWVYFLSGLLESWLRWIMQDYLVAIAQWPPHLLSFRRIYQHRLSTSRCFMNAKTSWAAPIKLWPALSVHVGPAWLNKGRY